MGFNLLKAAGGAIKGFVTGGPVNAIAGGVRAGFGAPQRQPTTYRPVPDSVVNSTLKLPFFESSRTTIYPSKGISNYPVTDGGGTAMAAAAAGCPTGFRLNKSTYVTRGGGTSRWPTGLQLHPAKSTCVRRRKMNAGNGRAALHAVRRLVSFYRLSTRVAKQLRRAAVKAHVGGGRRGQRRLSSGRNVEVVNVE